MGKQEIVDFLESIGGDGYGGMAVYEIAKSSAADLCNSEYGWVIERGDDPIDFDDVFLDRDFDYLCAI